MRRLLSAQLKFFVCAVATIIVAGCDDRSSAPSAGDNGGTVVIASTADPDALFPPLASNVPAKQVTELIYDYLANIGPRLNIVGDEGFTPALADSWEWAPDSLSIAFHINAAARWHDGVPVRAEDVAFTRSLYTSASLGNPMGEDLKNVDSVTVRDSLTSVFWFHSRTPSQFFTATNLMLILPRHLYVSIPSDSLREKASTINPIGSGRFRFVRWTQGASLEIAADTANYRGRPHVQRVIWSVTPDYVGALTRLNGGEADVFDALHVESVAEVARNARLRVVTLPGMDYAFLQFNLRDPKAHGSPHPIFGNREMRRALTMAIDRHALVKNVFDSLGDVAVGPTIRALPTTSASLGQIPYDTARAKLILDSLGWTGRTKDGMRTRNGKELAFTMIAPASSSARNRMAVLIQSQLARIGVRAAIEKMEYEAFAARQSARDFDATLGAWHTSADPSAAKEVWTTLASRKDGGRNYGSYENTQFDAALDSAVESRDEATARRFYTRAYQTIIDDAPAVWLYEPRTVLGIDKRINTTQMIPGTWWARLAEWSIPAGKRIRRDNSGVP